MARSTVNDWLVAGIALLQNRGHDALTIENLCRMLARTKGAFYHHFDDAAAISRALLHHWETTNTEALIVLANEKASPDERRARL